MIMAAMLVLQVLNIKLTYDERIAVGNLIAGLVIYAVTVNALYFTFRTYNWYHENVWKPFVYSELFKENYTLQYWEYKEVYEKEDEDRHKNSGRKSEFLEAIRLPNKGDGL